MKETHNSERLIRRVSPGTEPTRESERQVIIDVKRRTTLNKVNFLHWGRRLKYFIVSNSDDQDNEASGVINLTHRVSRSNNHLLDMELNYTAWCPLGKEKQVAIALSSGDDPGEVLSGLIAKWAKDYIGSQNGSFKVLSSESKRLLEDHIQTHARQETQLAIEVDFSVKSLPATPMRITDSFPVRAKDFYKEETLNIIVELDIATEAELDWITCTDAELQELIRTHIQDYFSHNVTLQHFYFKMNTDEFKYTLIRDLNEKLKSTGTKVVFLSLEREQKFPLPVESLKTQIDVAHRIDDLPDIFIKNFVFLKLQDASKYLTSGSPELIEWLESQLEKLITEELIRARFVDLVMGFQPFAGRIENALRLAASVIGYELDYLKIVPELDPNEWLAGIEFETVDSEEHFETSVANFFVKLGFSLIVKVKDLEGIKLFLEQHQNLPMLMEKALLNSTRQLLRETHPEQFYTRFSRPDTSGELTFEDKLKQRLSDVLQNDFNSEIIEATFINRETKITSALEELQSARPDFRVFIPHNRRHGEDTVFRGHFKIDKVDCNGWQEFRRVLPEIAQVKEHLETAIKTALENHPTALINFRDTLNLEAVHKVAEQAAQSTLMNAFGLKVTMTNLGSDAVESEKQIAESVTKARTESIERELERYFSITALVTNQIHKLEQEMVRVKAAGAQKEAIEDIQKRIDVLKSHTPAEPIVSELFYEYLRDAQ